MRHINKNIVLYLTGFLLLLNTFFMCSCIFISLYYDDNLHYPFLISGAISGALGGSMFYFNRNAPKKVGKREGYLIVSIGWSFMILTGMLPYLFSKAYFDADVFAGNDITFINFLYETISGYTTTGATVFDDIESIPKSLLYWRSLTHWIGGIGVIVLTIAIMPLLGIGGMQLFAAESTGVSADKIHPRITDTAKNLCGIYISSTILQIILLYSFGMNGFDAINHSLSSISSGGFSTKNNSILAWEDNIAIQYILTFFMIISGTNFIVLYLILQRNFKKVFRNDEFKWYLGIIFGASLIISVPMYFHAFGKEVFQFAFLEESFRLSIFHVVSILTSTGLIIRDYTVISPFVTLLFFSLMFIGGSAGSTSGGVKVIRQVILLKNSWMEFKRILHPHAIIPVRFNGRAISQNIVYNVMAFFILYMFIWISSSILFSLLNDGFSEGYDSIISGLSVTASAIGNIGPGIGKYGPTSTMNELSDSAKILIGFLMILGRLEIFTILILFTPSFWKNN